MPLPKSFQLPIKTWVNFTEQQPPIGTKVVIQARGYQEAEYTFECDCHENSLGIGPETCCYINYPGKGQVHVKELMWRRIDSQPQSYYTDGLGI